jgi:hypothetical protein
MTQPTHFPEHQIDEVIRFATWFPAADPREIVARHSDFNALIEYLSKANDLTWSETLETLDMLRLGAPRSNDRGELRAA